MVWVVLVGGGHAAGKEAVCAELKNELEALDSDLNLDVRLIDMSKYQLVKYKPQVDFPQLIQDIEQLDKLDKECIVLIHGYYALYNKDLRDLANVKIFVDTDADARLAQWIRRDVVSGKTDLAVILEEYLKHSRPEYIKYIQTTSVHADILLPKGADSLGISLVATSLADQIRTNKLSGSNKSFARSLDFDLRKEVYEEDLQYYAAN